MTTYNRETKQSDITATIVIGRDSDGTWYLGITGSGIPKTKFPFRAPFGIDLSPNLTPIEISSMSLKALIDTLNGVYQTAVALTSFKFVPSGNGARGGNAGMTKSRNNAQASMDDDIPF